MRIFTLILSLLFSTLSFGQQLQGYYRVQNAKSTRYLHVTDNTGKINTASMTADVSAIQPKMGLDKAIYDPSTVIYIEPQPGSQLYDLKAQGTSSHDIVSLYVGILQLDGNGTYRCFATYAGTTMYLADDSQTSSEIGRLRTVSASYTPKESMQWNVLPISSDSENYFGINPLKNAEVVIGDKYYCTFYASFPFSFVSSGMKAYKITGSDNTRACLEEVTETVIPASTPLILECSSKNPEDNKIDIKEVNVNALGGNVLEGVYFCRTTNTHFNATTYDPATMRVLGITADGNLGFVKSSEQYIAANSAYLPVVSTAADELRMVDKAEFDIPEGIDDVTTDNEPVSHNVYNISGTILKKNSTSLDGLAPGVYVINKKKVVLN